MPATLANRRFERKPRRTTSRALKTWGKVRTWVASSSIIRPSESSPITGKKLSRRRMFSWRTLFPGRVRAQVVGKCIENRECPLGREVENVRVLLLEDRSGTLERAGVLRAERGLHVARGRRDVREHDHRGPLGTVTPVVSWPTDNVMVLPPSRCLLLSPLEPYPTIFRLQSSRRSDRPSPAARTTA